MRSGRKLNWLRGGGIRSLPDAAKGSADNGGGHVDGVDKTGPFGPGLY